MSKIRFKKRIMPATGRMEQGAYCPDYWDGCADARSRRYGLESMASMCLSARSREYWAGYYKTYREVWGIEARASQRELHSLRLEQESALVSLAKSVGFDVDKYLAEGGRLRDLGQILARMSDHKSDKRRKDFWKKPERATARA